MGSRCFIPLLLLFAWAIPSFSAPSSPPKETGRAVVLTLEGAIGPAKTEYLRKNFEKAAEEEAALVIVRMDTPGGLSSSMRDLVQAIRESTVPVVFYVTPSGARAASAGTYLLYASHVAAMAPATTLGAATPVQIGGGALPGSPSSPADAPEKKGETETEKAEDGEDASPAPVGDAMKRKVVNDAAAFIRGLAKERGRNAEWAEKAVREAVSLTAAEALEKNVIDIVADDMGDLLRQANGMEVDVRERSFALETEHLTLEERDPGWRTELLGLITNPTVAYLLLMLGIYGLIFEGMNPGALVPGVLGGICLIVALFAFQILPVNYAGLLLIVLGVALMVVEAFAPSFGILGIGGIVAMVFGSIILMDTDVPGFTIPTGVIAGIAAGTGVIFLAVILLVFKAWKRPVVSGREQLVGETVEVVSDFDERGWVRYRGEQWRAETDAPLKSGERATIAGIDGLTLHVQREQNERTSS